MTTKRNTGFTIIEVMLFLAVSGFLAVALLYGMQTSIERQRYYDSLTSLKSYLQMQYTYAANVLNDRPNDSTGKPTNISCDVNARLKVVSSVEVNTGLGMSECVIMGRYIYTNSDATKLTASHVIGVRDQTKEPGTDDLAELSNFRYSSLFNDDSSGIDGYYQPELYSLSANEQLQDSTKKPTPFQMLIMRSPTTGMILTFITKGGPDGNIANLIKNGKNDQPTILCLAPTNPSVIPMTKMAIRINAFATNQAGVEIPKETDNVCGR